MKQLPRFIQISPFHRRPFALDIINPLLCICVRRSEPIVPAQTTYGFSLIPGTATPTGKIPMHKAVTGPTEMTYMINTKKSIPHVMHFVNQSLIE